MLSRLFRSSLKIIGVFISLLIFAVLFFACENWPTDVKPRSNPLDGNFTHNQARILDNTKDKTADKMTNLEITWTFNSNEVLLYQPQLIIQSTISGKIIKSEILSDAPKEGNRVYSVSSILNDSLDIIQVYLKQSFQNKVWLDSLNDPVLLYDPAYTPILSPLINTGKTKSSLEFSSKVVRLGVGSVDEIGICYSSNSNATILNEKLVFAKPYQDGSNLSTLLSNLKAYKNYYCRLYYLKNGTYKYLAERAFKTSSPDNPSAGSTTITNVTGSGFICKSSVNSDGGGTIIEKGFCYGTSQNPDISGSMIISNSVGSLIEAKITGLKRVTDYFVRSYVKNEAGIQYGAQTKIKTADYTVVSKNTCDQLGGNGQYQFTARCEYWSGTAYMWSNWVVKSGGYSGNGIVAESPKCCPLGGYVEFKYDFKNSGKVRLWVLAAQAGYKNRMPNFTVDGVAGAQPTKVAGGDIAEWMQIETPEISAGTHTIKFEWGRIGTFYTYIVDEIEILE